MNRRSFITLIGGATAWPLLAQAQQAAMPVIGFLNSQSPDNFTHLVAAFRSGINGAGLVEGRNVSIEFRWANRQYSQLPFLAADLVHRQVSVIVGTGGSHPAAIAATETIPIVCSFGGDPVKDGFVESIKRPGKNVTGALVYTTDLEAKRLELVHEMVPSAGQIGVFVDPNLAQKEEQLKEAQTAAHALGRKILAVEVGRDSDIDVAFATLVQARVVALVVTASTFFNYRRDQLVALAARHRIPAIYEARESVLAGGLMSYGTNLPDVFRQVGDYTARILKGEKPADLPVVLPTKFDMAVNQTTAKALGIAVPTGLLLRADEVIE